MSAAATFLHSLEREQKAEIMLCLFWELLGIIASIAESHTEKLGF